MSIGEYKIKEAIVLSRNNISQEGRITYAPLYASFCLAELIVATESDFTLVPVLP